MAGVLFMIVFIAAGTLSPPWDNKAEPSKAERIDLMTEELEDIERRLQRIHKRIKTREALTQPATGPSGATGL